MKYKCKSEHEEVISLTKLCNEHAEYIGKLEDKVERGATSLGGGTGRAKLKLLEVKCNHQDAGFQRQVSTYLGNLAEGGIKEIWCQTDFFGLAQNFGLIVEA